MKRPTPFLLRRALGLLLALLAWPALTQQAQPARYNVEIVVFRAVDESPASENPPASGASADIAATPVTAGKLSDAASRLRASGAYRVLGQAAWTQVPAPWNSGRGVSLGQIGLGNGLSGSVILERGQYLHLGFDLQYTEGGRHWVINELRRVKVNERQYYDHPALGVIAIVTPAGGN
ncbi:MAG: hypothetical protein QM696_02140 [Steroidobacteraceae bacterium]